MGKLYAVGFNLTANGSRLCAGGALKHESLIEIQKFMNSTNDKLEHETPHDGKPLLCAGAVYLAGF